MKAHPCNNRKCLANFNDRCRQTKLQCHLHMTKGTVENKYYINQDILEEDNE